MTKLSRRQVLTGALAAGALRFSARAAENRRVAVTLDDGPVTGNFRDLARMQRITAALIAALKAENVPSTIFMNEEQLHVAGERDARAAVLEQWLDAGFDLGNHTYAHPNLNNIPLWQYLDGIVQGSVLMRSVLERRGRKLEWFRHPYLRTGHTPEVRKAIDSFLAERGYRVAPVTVDYADYAFSSGYATQMEKGNEQVAEKIRQAYEAQVDAGFEQSEGISRELLGYELPQILLLHCNPLNAVSLRATLQTMRKRGYSFITLDEAMRDPAYQRQEAFIGPGGMNWLRRWALAMGKPLPPSTVRVPDWVQALYDPTQQY